MSGTATWTGAAAVSGTPAGSGTATVSGTAAVTHRDDAARTDLLAQRSRTRQLLHDLRADLDAVFAATAGANVDDEHDPEGATIAFERSQLAVGIQAADTRLEGIEAALARMDTGAYGTCERCGADIGAARLAARPASSRCLACAR